MAREQYRHIFLGGPTHTQRYTSPRRGGSSPRIPDRPDRAGHSAYLLGRFAQAWEEQHRTQRQAVVHAQRHGAYIEFVSEPGFDLMVQSLEAMRSGIRLQSVRMEGESGRERTLEGV